MRSMDAWPNPRRLLCLIALATLLAPVRLVAEPVVRLTSLEWPPYAGEALTEGGSQVALVRRAYAAVGVRLEVQFLPFRRAVQLARTDPAIAGYFPEYIEVDDDFTVSMVLGVSPLGLVYRVDRPLVWARLADLAAFQPIGVVAGYLNEPELDRLIAERALRAEPALDDVGNLRRLIHGRVGAAVIDQAVLRFLLVHTPDLAGAAARVRFHPRLLAERSLHVAFRRLPQGDAARRLLDQGLMRLDPAQLHPYAQSGP